VKVKMLLTSVSSVWSRSGLCLNRSDSGFGLFVYDGIMLILQRA